jgi:hypothetical protein
VLLKRDGTRAETRFRLSPKRTSPFKSVGALVQSTAGSRSVRISFGNAGYTMFRGTVRVLATHSIRQFPLHFSSPASPCAIRFQLDSTTHTFLTSILDGEVWSISRPRRITHGRNADATLVAGYGHYGEEKNLVPQPRIEPRPT